MPRLVVPVRRQSWQHHARLLGLSRVSRAAVLLVLAVERRIPSCATRERLETQQSGRRATGSGGGSQRHQARAAAATP